MNPLQHTVLQYVLRLFTTLVFLHFSVSNYCFIKSIRETIHCVIGQSTWVSGSLSTFITNIKPNWKHECTVRPWERLHTQDLQLTSPQSLILCPLNFIFILSAPSTTQTSSFHPPLSLVFLWSVYHVWMCRGSSFFSSLSHTLIPLCLHACAWCPAGIILPQGCNQYMREQMYCWLPLSETHIL